MPDDRAAPPDYLGLARDYDPASEEFAELRELLLGAERRQLAQLQRKLDKQQSPEGLADQLPEAIALRSGRDRQLARALAPTIDDAITESVRQNPREIATAIFPVLGPAIRKALAEAMSALVDSINRAVEHTFSFRGLKWRLEAWRTGTPYAQIVIKHALVYRVEQVFLIHAETGLLLAHAAPPELKVTDADLISGMLTAIQDFVADSFQQQEAGRLRTFSVGELNVIVEAGPQAVIAAVVRGQPPETLLLKLQERLEIVHLQFAAAFADFSGNPKPFAPAQPLLEECLETVLRHQRPRSERGRLTWLVWALPLLLLAVALGWLAWTRQRRWTDAVERLRAEPGIEIVEADRSGRTWRFRGLKDPLAAEPAVILAGLGADTARLDARWKPYVSLEPGLVAARARQALSAPATVTFRLSRDTLYAEGTAPLAWVARASALPMLPPGISFLGLSGVTATLSPELVALKSRVEGLLILFAVGSARMTPGARGVLDSAATAFRRLSAVTGRLGYRADLDLLGRADTTGTDATNQNLSRWRVDAVRALLVELGIPADVLGGVSLGVSNPLPGRDGLDQAQANRSVAFVVRVRPEPSEPDGAR
jgi:outer membrane protein OmpA-like peptidoglycan-associated protein